MTQRMKLVREGSTVSVRVALVALAVAGGVGYYLGFERAQPDPAPQVYAQPAKKVPGGVRAAVNPIAPEAAKPRQKLEKGEKVLAVGSVTVRPATARTGAPSPITDATSTPACSCEPVTLDFTAVRDKAGQPGLYVTSENGEVTDGSFSPLFQFQEPPRLPAVLAAGTNGRGASVLYGRDLGPFWVGGQAIYDPQTGVGGFVHFGVRLR